MPQGNEGLTAAVPDDSAVSGPLPPATEAGSGERPAKVPLPPAAVPGGHPLPPDAPPMPSEPPRAKQPLPPPADDADTDPGLEGDGASGREWWRTAADMRDELRDELREVWDTDGQEAMQAAAEIGAQIGQAVAAAAARLPDPYAAGQRHGLDLRWLRLGVTVPGLALALLATWGGQSPADRMTHYAAREGLWAPLGWVLLPAMILAMLPALPGGGVVGAVLGGLARGITALLRRAWAVPVLGYLLRLAVAVAAWSLAFAGARLVGRSALHVLTGV